MRLLRKLKMVYHRVRAVTSSGRVSLSESAIVGNLAVYLLRIDGCRVRRIKGGSEFPNDALPWPVDGLEWLMKFSDRWWGQDYTTESFTYCGPERHPCELKMEKVPTWALPAIRRLVGKALERDQIPQRSYVERGAYR